MDVDIDFKNRDHALSVLKHIKAARRVDLGLVPHNTGVYFQSIPYNPVENLSNIDYKSAEDRGYFKIDFLNVTVYENVKNEEHLLKLMDQEPLWDLLLDEEFVNLLFQINGHADILKQMKPTSIEQLAAVLAIIRPAKRYLIGKDWDTVFKEVWVRPLTDEYYWKKSHAFAYAVAIVVQMNLICESILPPR